MKSEVKSDVEALMASATLIWGCGEDHFNNILVDCLAYISSKDQDNKLGNWQLLEEYWGKQL
jgi:hypothetical protein